MDDRSAAYEPVLDMHSAGDRAFVKSLLDAEGITYFIQGECVAPYLFNAMPMRVMVRKDQAEKTRAILRDVDFSFAFNIPPARGAGQAGG